MFDDPLKHQLAVGLVKVGAWRVEADSERTTLKTSVPQAEHFPLSVRRPFFMTSSTASFISRRSRHSEQYASVI